MRLNKKKKLQSVFTAAACVVATYGVEASAQCSIPSLDNGLTISSSYSHSSVLSGNFRATKSPQTRPNTNTSEDSQIRPRYCPQNIIDQLWDHYDFDKGDWDDGRGFDNPCSVTRMLGRTFAGLTVLNWSTPDPHSTWSDLSGNALQWGGNYAAKHIDELDGRCSWNGSCNPGSCTMATTRTGGIFVNEWTRIYKGLVYQYTPFYRAAILLHEARHAGGKGHNGNDGSNPCPARSSSCDESYTDSSSARANSYQSWFAQWYLFEGTSTTTTQRRSAQRSTNWNLSNRFDNAPGFIFNANSGRCNGCSTPSSTI